MAESQYDKKQREERRTRGARMDALTKVQGKTVTLTVKGRKLKGKVIDIGRWRVYLSTAKQGIRYEDVSALSYQTKTQHHKDFATGRFREDRS